MADDEQIELDGHNRMKARYDQITAELADAFPPMWKRLFEGLKREGFEEDQAFTLLKTYIISMGSGDKAPPS